jgi:SAM-dependent methyltransferase
MFMNNVDYKHDEETHNTRSANLILPYLLNLINPKSVVDFGCGLGTWLNVFKKYGCSNILGIDGVDVDAEKLAIRRSEFLVHDLTTPIKLDQKYDLALCLEVVEHLPENKSHLIVDMLIAASDCILFSAALPLQGGQNHLNEKSFKYWVTLFNERGFIVKDLFRKEIWNNKDIDWWYKQNLFLIIKSPEIQEPILDYYHPDRYQEIVSYNSRNLEQIHKLNTGKIELKTALTILLKCIKRKVYDK